MPTRILSHFAILVYPREGDDIEALKQKFPTMRVIEAPMLPISATEIREQLRKGEATPWLDSRVAKELQHIYGSASQ